MYLSWENEVESSRCAMLLFYQNPFVARLRLGRRKRQRLVNNSPLVLKQIEVRIHFGLAQRGGYYSTLQTAFQERLNGAFWKKVENQKRFIDWLGTQLGYKQLADWYKVSVEDINKYGGKLLLSEQYNGSPSKVLQKVYPEHQWMPWRFNKTPNGYWQYVSQDRQEQKRIVDWLGEQLCVTTLDDWYRISLSQVRELASFGGLSSSAALAQILSSVYPWHPWNQDKLMHRFGFSQPKASQRQVTIAMRELFPQHSEYTIFTLILLKNNFKWNVVSST